MVQFISASLFKAWGIKLIQFNFKLNNVALGTLAKIISLYWLEEKIQLHLLFYLFFIGVPEHIMTYNSFILLELEKLQRDCFPMFGM